MSKVIVIAEAGVNHNGDVGLAKKLIESASEAGCDYVKFQTFRSGNLVSATAKKADYQVENTGNANSQLSMLQKLELSEDSHYELIAHCEKFSIKFLSTAFDTDSVDFLRKLGMNIWKIPSGEITNLPHLKKIGAFGQKVILSTGMADMQEIKNAVGILVKAGTPKEKISVLHCNTEYPTPFNDVNLRAMNAIGNALDVQVGYSDHTIGIEVPVAAVALGATIIEKHFTLDCNMEGPDHKSSLEPEQLKKMVMAIRNIELALGSELKKPTASEMKNITNVRKSIHLKNSLHAGQLITYNDLSMMRPGDGISPMEIDNVLGKKLLYDAEAGYKIKWADLA